MLLSNVFRSGCKQLEHVDLSYCSVTHEGVMSLVEGCGQLISLSLQYCGEVRPLF